MREGHCQQTRVCLHGGRGGWHSLRSPAHLAGDCSWFGAVVALTALLVGCLCGNREWSLRSQAAPPAFGAVWVGGDAGYRFRLGAGARPTQCERSACIHVRRIDRATGHWYFSIGAATPLLRAHPAATANLSARSLEGFVRDRRIPDFLKVRFKPLCAGDNYAQMVVCECNWPLWW